MISTMLPCSHPVAYLGFHEGNSHVILFTSWSMFLICVILALNIGFSDVLISPFFPSWFLSSITDHPDHYGLLEGFI